METNSPISNAEMERRWAVARQVMQTLEVDALVAQAREDWVGSYVRWLTDIPANNGYPRTVAFFPDRPMTVVEMGPFGGDRDLTGDTVNRGVGRMLQTPSFVSVGYTMRYDAELLVKALSEAGAKRIGLLCPDALPHAIIRALGAAGFETVDASDALDAAKAIKSTEEIELIRATAELQDKVFAEVCDFLGLSAPMGQPSRFFNRPLQTRTIQQGDHLSMLIEINGPGGLYCEIARTMVLGKADDHLLQAFENVRMAQENTLSLIRPGADPAEIAARHDAWMEARGLPPEIRLYAHGQGVEMVERPLIRSDETLRLAEGMCLAVHPGYDDGRAFAVICDNYMVTADGVSACLHKTEKKIFEL